MEVKLDLHIHSVRSPDGCMGLEEIVERAKAAGLQGAAVCDHDRVMEDVPEVPGFLVIPGVEVSTDRGHLLGLFVRGPVESRAAEEAIREIHEQRGLAVLAHPFQRRRDGGHILPIVQLLDGLEVWNGRADRKNRRANEMAETFAGEHGLRPFAGSDAHVPREVGNGVLQVEAEALTLEAVKTALMEGKGQVIRRVESRAWYTAKSQLNKLRRTGAGPLAYGKWAAFAGKCLVRDMLR